MRNIYTVSITKLRNTLSTGSSSEALLSATGENVVRVGNTHAFLHLNQLLFRKDAKRERHTQKESGRGDNPQRLTTEASDRLDKGLYASEGGRNALTVLRGENVLQGNDTVGEGLVDVEVILLSEVVVREIVLFGDVSTLDALLLKVRTANFFDFNHLYM